MTKPDIASAPDGEGRDYTSLKRIALISLAILLLAYLLGLAVGFTMRVIRDGSPSLVDGAILSGIVAAIAAIVWASWRYWPRSSDEPEAPRVKKSRMMIYASLALGFALGLALAFGTDDGLEIFSNGLISPVVAGIALAVWLVAVPVGTWWWLRTVDEHEAGAYREGGFVAVHAYLIVSPAWWLATRAGWLPPQDPMIILVAVAFLWTAVWMVKRYL